MKKLVILFIFSISLINAQEKITKKLGDFNTLKVFNGLPVEIKKGDTAKIEIFGTQSDDVVVKNSDGILKVRLRFPDSFTAEDVKIILYYTNNIAVLDANEGSKIFSNETVTQKHLEVKVQEGAKIKLPVNVKYLVVKSVTGGVIKLTGTTQNQTVEATTGGIYFSYKLQSKQAIITAASGARVEVSVADVLDAKVRFGGTILYKGTPDVKKIKKIIGGTIKNKN